MYNNFYLKNILISIQIYYKTFVDFSIPNLYYGGFICVPLYCSCYFITYLNIVSNLKFLARHHSNKETSLTPVPTFHQ